MFPSSNRFSIKDDFDVEHVKKNTVELSSVQHQTKGNKIFQFLVPLKFKFKKKHSDSVLRFTSECQGEVDDLGSKIIAGGYRGQFVALVEDVASDIDEISNVLKHKTREEKPELFANRQTWVEGNSAKIEYHLANRDEKKGILDVYLLGILRPDSRVPDELPLNQLKVVVRAEEVLGNASNPLGELTITFGENGAQGFAYDESMMLDKFNQIAHRLTGNGYSLHPKQLLTVDVLASILNHSTVGSWPEKVNVGYIGLDTAENLTSVLRHIHRSKLEKRIKSFTVFYSEKWDKTYKTRLEPYLADLNIEIHWRNVDPEPPNLVVSQNAKQISDEETLPKIHIMISTYVALWAAGPDAIRRNEQDKYFKQAYENCDEEALLLSVDPIDREKITRSSDSFFPLHIENYYSTQFTKREIGEITLVENALCRATLWQKGSRNWEVVSDPQQRTLKPNSPPQKSPKKKRFRGASRSIEIGNDHSFQGVNIEISNEKLNKTKDKLSLSNNRRGVDSLQRASQKNQRSPFLNFLNRKSDLIYCCGIPTQARDLHIAENIEGINEVYFHNEFTGKSEEIVPFSFNDKERLIKNPEGEPGSGPVKGFQWARRPTGRSRSSFSFMAKNGLLEAALVMQSSELTVLTGNPGSGKSVRLRQIGHAINSQSTRTYCLQVNAKDLVKAKSTLRAKLGEDYSEESMLDVIVAAYLLSNPLAEDFGFDAASIIHEIESTRITQGSGYTLEAISSSPHWSEHLAKVSLLVDAIDEVSSDEDLASMLAFCRSFYQIHGTSLLISTRKSHFHHLKKWFSRFNHISMFNNPVSLKDEFVRKLVSSWSMPEDLANGAVDKVQKDSMFQFVNNPLLIGWLCYFIMNRIEVSDDPSNFYDEIFKTASKHSRLSSPKMLDDDHSELMLNLCRAVAFHDILGEQRSRFAFATQHDRLKFLEDMGATSQDEMGNNGKRILDKLHGELFENLSLLFVSGTGRLGWTHEYLREYAAAMHYLLLRDSLKSLNESDRIQIEGDLAAFDEELKIRRYCDEIIQSNLNGPKRQRIKTLFLLEQISNMSTLPGWRLWRALHLNLDLEFGPEGAPKSMVPILQKIVRLFMRGEFSQGLLSEPEHINMAGGGIIPHLCETHMSMDEMRELFSSYAENFDMEINVYNEGSISAIFVRGFLEAFRRESNFSNRNALQRARKQAYEGRYKEFMRGVRKVAPELALWGESGSISMRLWYENIETEHMSDDVGGEIISALRDRYLDITKLVEEDNLLNDLDGSYSGNNKLHNALTDMFENTPLETIVIETQPMLDTQTETNWINSLNTLSDISFKTTLAYGEYMDGGVGSTGFILDGQHNFQRISLLLLYLYESLEIEVPDAFSRLMFSDGYAEEPIETAQLFNEHIDEYFEFLDGFGWTADSLNNYRSILFDYQVFELAIAEEEDEEEGGHSE